MFAPEQIFKSVSKLGTFGGFLSIGNVKCSESCQFAINIYLVGMFTMFSFQITCLIAVLIFRINLLDDGSGVVCVLAIMVNNILLIVFYVVRKNKIAQNYDDMLKLVKTIAKSPANNKFLHKVKKLSNYTDKLVLMCMLSIYILLVAEFLLKGLSYAQVIDLIPSKGYLIYALPWNVDDTATFWTSLLFQTISTFFMTIVQQANHYYMMTMLTLQTLCFEYLRLSLVHIISNKNITLEDVECSKKSVIKNYDCSIEKSIKCWTALHVQLIKLCREFVDIYTPLFVSYFTVMFVTLTCGVFSITQNDYYYGLVEEILLGLYFAGIILNLFMLSIAGSNLSFESQRTFEEAFQAPWYDCSPEVQSSLKIICAVTKQPIRMAAFGSHQFCISLHTFIWVMKAMVSFYIGLAQMKRLAKIRSNDGHNTEMPSNVIY